jgi:hypothetical protein
MGFGGVGWATPSTMAGTGHLYAVDQDLNASFPAQITATKFNGTATTATTANQLNGMTATSSQTWGNQTGTFVHGENDSTGGSWAFRRDNPSSGQVSMILDGTVYIKEGGVNVSDAIKSITRSGTTFTYTTLWGNTGTFSQQDNNTTYTFANGTNGFTVTPSGGSAQTVTVTPSIANNVTGSGTSGYIAKFNGGNTITNGPALGSSTTTFLRNDGQWAVPPTASSGNKIFIVEPTPPYSVGDLWVIDDNNISVCMAARASGSFDDDDWGSAVDAVSNDELQSAVTSAISDAITIVTGNGESGGNIILKMNSSNVPYELLVTDTPTNITSNSAKIYRWDGNGLRFSSTGYNGTYATLINASGQIPAQYLTGNLNAGVVAIQNFTAAMVHGGVLTRGKANNQDGTIEVYDANGTLIATVSNEGFKYYGQGTGADRPYYLINTSGFIGYTKVNGTWTQTVKVAFDEFRMVKGYVGEELNIGDMIKIVPMTTSANSGIAFTAVT